MAYCDGTTAQIVGRVLCRRLIFVDGYYYMFYYGTSYLSYSSTADVDCSEDQFGSENALSGIGVASSLVYDLTVCTEGKYVHLAYLYNSTDIRYVRGTVSSGTITFDSYQAVASSLTTPRCWSICISDNHVYIGASAGSSTQHARVWRNSNTVESSTWSNDANFTSSGKQVSTTAVANLFCQIVPMTGGAIYVGWATASTGASLYGKTCSSTGTVGSLETISTSPTAADNFGWSMVSYNDEIWVAWEGVQTYYYTWVKHRNASATWESTTSLGGGSGIGADNVTPVLAVNNDTGDVWCFWRHTSNYHVYYRKYDYGSATWETEVDWGATSTTGDAGYFGAMYDNQGGYVVCYFGVNTASPYEVENLALEAPLGSGAGPSAGCMMFDGVGIL